MGGRTTLAMIVALASAQPSLAAGPAIAAPGVQTAAMASASEKGLSNGEIQAAVLVSAMAGAMFGAAGKDREKERLSLGVRSAEAALLAGAGLLSHIPGVPVCLATEPLPSPACQIVKKHQAR